MTGRQVLFGAGLAGAGVLIANYFNQQRKLIEQMGYQIRNVRVLKQTAQEVVVSFDFVLQNNSDIQFRLTGLDINVYTLSGDFLARFRDPNLNKLIPAKTASEPLPIVIKFDPRKLGLSVLQLVTDLLSGEGLALRFVGNVSATTGIIGFQRLAIDFTYRPLSGN